MNYRRLIVGLLILTITLSAQVITKGPYLADPEPGHIIIRWEVDKAAKGRVYYGQSSKLKQSVKAVLLGEVADHFLYEAALNDLVPGSKYGYQVKVGRKKGDRLSFTAPPTPDTACNFAISGDSRSRPQIFTKIIEGIAQSDPEFIISMGDLVEDGGNYGQWDKFYFGPAKDLISNRPFISTLGDHEGSGDEGELVEHFLFPELEHEELWYSFDYGMVHFISLDYRHEDSEKMMTWFEEDMRASEAKWNIVFMHRPSYNLGGHRSFWGNPHWPDLFQKHKVDVVFGGHSHIYERFHPVYTAGNEDWPITYVTTGGSGASLYDAVQNPVLAYAQSVNHYADVNLDAEKLVLRTYDIDGMLIDSLQIDKLADGSLAEKYIQSANLRDELDIIGIFAGPISWSIDAPPLPERPAHKKFSLDAGSLKQAVEFELRLSDESLEKYTMDPFVAEIKPGEELEIELKIRGTGGVCINPWGGIDPPFKIEAHYKQGEVSGVVIGKNVNMKSWGE